MIFWSKYFQINKILQYTAETKSVRYYNEHVNSALFLFHIMYNLRLNGQNTINVVKWSPNTQNFWHRNILPLRNNVHPCVFQWLGLHFPLMVHMVEQKLSEIAQ